MHVAVYALLTVLWVWTLQAIESWLPKLLLAFALSLSIGVALEWYQMSVPGRFGTITDVLLNGIGVIAGLIIAFFLL
jgi:VanZ family protein